MTAAHKRQMIVKSLVENPHAAKSMKNKRNRQAVPSDDIDTRNRFEPRGNEVQGSFINLSPTPKNEASEDRRNKASSARRSQTSNSRNSTVMQSEPQTVKGMIQQINRQRERK